MWTSFNISVIHLFLPRGVLHITHITSTLNCQWGALHIAHVTLTLNCWWGRMVSSTFHMQSMSHYGGQVGVWYLPNFTSKVTLHWGGLGYPPHLINQIGCTSAVKPNWLPNQCLQNLSQHQKAWRSLLSGTLFFWSRQTTLMITQAKKLLKHWDWSLKDSWPQRSSN